MRQFQGINEKTELMSPLLGILTAVNIVCIARVAGSDLLTGIFICMKVFLNHAIGNDLWQTTKVTKKSIG